MPKEKKSKNNKKKNLKNIYILEIKNLIKFLIKKKNYLKNRNEYSAENEFKENINIKMFKEEENNNSNKNII